MTVSSPFSFKNFTFLFTISIISPLLGHMIKNTINLATKIIYESAKIEPIIGKGTKKALKLEKSG